MRKSFWILLFIILFSIFWAFVVLRELHYYMQEHPLVEQQSKASDNGDSLLQSSKKLVP